MSINWFKLRRIEFTFGTGHVRIKSLHWKSLGLNQQFLHHRIPCALEDDRRWTAFSREQIVNGGRNGDIVTTQLIGVDDEMVNQTGFRWNAELSRIIDETVISIWDQLNRLRLSQCQSNGKGLSCVIKDGHFKFQFLGPLHRIGKVQFEEKWLKGFDFRRWTHSESKRLGDTQRPTDPIGDCVRQFNRFLHFSFRTKKKIICKLFRTVNFNFDCIKYNVLLQSD